MTVRRKDEIAGLREAGRVVRQCLLAVTDRVRAGVTTAQLDEVAAGVFGRNGARSAPVLVYGFPGQVCISVNDEIVHGVPSCRVLREGDLVKLDVTAEKEGYMADAALTVGVGTIPPDRRALIDCARRAFRRAMRVARAGERLSAIGRAIEAEVGRSGFAVVRELAGHGIGRTIHEEPTVLNFENPRDRRRLVEGMVLAVEPIIAMGSGRSETAADGWTIRTVDGALAAHYEQTIIVTADAPILVTEAA
jgi:methionyl aminopeptidase